MLPVAFQSKVDHHVQIGDANLNVAVVDRQEILAMKLSQFQSSLGKRIVGVSLHQPIFADIDDPILPYEDEFLFRWLCLCNDTQCLMIDLNIGHNNLKEFLSDQTICFAALRPIHEIPVRDSTGCVKYIRCLGVGDLGCRVMKKPEMRYYKLEQLVAEVGVDVKPQLQTLTKEEWDNAIYFSTEQMKCAVHESYYSFAIAHKLLVG